MEKNAVITTRVPIEVKDFLYQQSQINNISVNTLIAKIVTKHAKWDNLVENIGFFFLSKKIIKEIFKHLTKNQVIKIGASTGREMLKELSIVLYGDFNRETLSKTIVDWCEYSNIGIRLMGSNYEKFIIQHEFGSNWNSFFVSMLESAFAEINISLKNIIQENDFISFDIVPLKGKI